MKIVQVTDLHIDRENESPYEIDVRRNFKRVLNAIRRLKPGHIVVSGDLCYNVGETEIYDWIKGQLDRIKIPYDIIAGNHDDSKMMAEAFNLKHLMNDDELYYAKKLGKATCIFLFHSQENLK